MHPLWVQQRRRPWMLINAIFNQKGLHERRKPLSGCRLSQARHQVTRSGSRSLSEKPRSPNNSQSTHWKDEKKRLGRNLYQRDIINMQGCSMRKTRRNSLIDTLGTTPSI